MQDKKQKLEALITEYQQIQQQEEYLHSLQQSITNEKDIELYGVLKVKGETFSLHDLLEKSAKQLYEYFEEDVSLLISYLLKKLEERKIMLLDSVEFIEEQNTVQQEDLPKEKETDLEDFPKETINEIVESKQPILEHVKTIIHDFPKGTIINPSDILESLPPSYKEKISLSDIHDLILSEYVHVQKKKMKMIYHATCFKCDAHFEKDYEVLPRNIVCEHCGEDIISIEFHYEKLF